MTNRKEILELELRGYTLKTKRGIGQGSVSAWYEHISDDKTYTPLFNYTITVGYGTSDGSAEITEATRKVRKWISKKKQ